MTVKEAIEELKKLPQDAVLMVPDLGVGGSVTIEKFVGVDREWVDVELAKE